MYRCVYRTIYYIDIHTNGKRKVSSGGGCGMVYVFEKFSFSFSFSYNITASAVYLKRVDKIFLFCTEKDI